MTILEDRIAPNAVILWDDLCNYPAWKAHEVMMLCLDMYRSVHASSASFISASIIFETGKLFAQGLAAVTRAPANPQQ